MHLRTHVAWVERVDPDRRLLSSEHLADLFERRLGGAVAAPTFIWLEGRIGGDVHDGAARHDDERQRSLDEPEWTEHVHPVDLGEHVEGICTQRRLRRGSEDTGVVDQQVEAAQIAYRGHEIGSMRGVCDVARDSADVDRRGGRPYLVGGGLQVEVAAGVEHEVPSPCGHVGSEGSTEPTRCSGDKCGRHDDQSKT